MADFVAPQFQNPDFLGSYIRGQVAGQQAAAFPGDMQLQQQKVQEGQLSLQQLQMAMRFKQDLYGRVLSEMQPGQSGTQSTQTGEQPGGPTAGNAVDLQGGAEGGMQGGYDNSGNYGYKPTNLSSGTLQAIGMVAPEMLKGLQEGDAIALQKAQVTSQLQGSPLVTLQAFSSNPNAGDALMQPGNAAMLAKWPMAARKYGFDPKDMSNINVRMVATLAANEQRAALKMPLLPMPTGYKDVEGPYGQHIQVQQGGETPGKETEVTGQKPPTYSPEAGQNPNNGQKSVTMLQTSPGGMPSPFAKGSGGPQGGGVGQVVGKPTDVGYAPPSAPEQKAAMFASEMRAGLNTLNRLESKGITLSPATRTAFLSAATSEDTGSLHLLFGQEALAHGMTKDEQTYMAALMPMLQAAGHDQSGARLPTSQVRQNIESLLPIDIKNKDALDQVRQNRQGFYVGLLGQAGSAVQAPQYRDTLAFDLAKIQAKARGNSPTPYADADKEARYQAWKKANNR